MKILYGLRMLGMAALIAASVTLFPCWVAKSILALEEEGPASKDLTPPLDITKFQDLTNYLAEYIKTNPPNALAIHGTNYLQFANSTNNPAFEFEIDRITRFGCSQPNTNALKIQHCGGNILWITNASVITNITLRPQGL